jgi:hypothetical protein
MANHFIFLPKIRVRQRGDLPLRTPDDITKSSSRKALDYGNRSQYRFTDAYTLLWNSACNKQEKRTYNDNFAYQPSNAPDTLSVNQQPGEYRNAPADRSVESWQRLLEHVPTDQGDSHKDRVAHVLADCEAAATAVKAIAKKLTADIAKIDAEEETKQNLWTRANFLAIEPTTVFDAAGLYEFVLHALNASHDRGSVDLSAELGADITFRRGDQTFLIQLKNWLETRNATTHSTADTITSPDPLEAAKIAARARARQYIVDEWNSPQNLSLEAAAEYTGRSGRTINKDRQEGRLYALLLPGNSRRYRYPLWQFDAEPDRLKVSIHPFLEAGKDCWVLHHFLTRKTEALDGDSPRDWILDNSQPIERVVAAAKYKLPTADQGAA